MSELSRHRTYLSIVPMWIVASISFLIGTLFGKDFSTVNWETILAGILGLGGGAFALLATRWSEHRKEIKSVYGYCMKVSKRSDLTILKLGSLRELANSGRRMPADRYNFIAEVVTKLLPTELSADAPIEILERHAEIEIALEAISMIEPSTTAQDRVQIINTIESISGSISLLKESCETHLSKMKRHSS